MPPAKRRTARKTAAKKTTARRPAKRRTAKKSTAARKPAKRAQPRRQRRRRPRRSAGPPRSRLRSGPRRSAGARRRRGEAGSGEAQDRQEGDCEAGPGEAPEPRRRQRRRRRPRSAQHQRRLRPSAAPGEASHRQARRPKRAPAKRRVDQAPVVSSNQRRRNGGPSGGPASRAQSSVMSLNSSRAGRWRPRRGSRGPRTRRAARRCRVRLRRCPSSSATGCGGASSAVDLRADRGVVDRLDVVDLLGLEQQERVGPVGRDPRPGKKCGSRAATMPSMSSSARRVGDRGAAGSASTGRGRAPRSGRDRRITAQTTLRVRRDRLSSSPSTSPRSGRRAAPRARAAAALLVDRAVDERGEVGARVPGALRAVGEDEQLDVGAGARPLRQRRAAPELDVVGMRADRQHPRRDRQIDRAGRRVTVRASRPSQVRAASSTEVVGDVDVEARGSGRARRAAASPSRRAASPRAGGTSPGRTRSGSRARSGPRAPACRRRGGTARALTTGRIAVVREPARAPRRTADRRGRRRHAAQPAVARSASTSGGGGRVERCRDRRATASPCRRTAQSRDLGSRGHDDDGQRRRGLHDPRRPVAGPAPPASARSSASARRALPSANVRIGTTTPNAARMAPSYRLHRSIAPRCTVAAARGIHRLHVCSPMPWQLRSEFVTRLAVIGAGSWGTTVAAICASERDDVLWGRDPELVDAIAQRPREPPLPPGRRAAGRVAGDDATSTPRARAPTSS